MNCGVQQVVEALRRTAELDAKCPIYERLTSTSPLNDVLEFSSSLEKLSILLAKTQKQANSGSIPPINADDPSNSNKKEPSKSTTDKVDAPKPQNQPQNKQQTSEIPTPPSFIFDKEGFEKDTNMNSLSELSKALGDRKGAVIRKAEMVVIVFTPSRHRLKVKIEKSATVEEVVRATLQQYHMDGLSPLLSSPPDNYYLMMAEEDGTPDREVPQLNPRHLIQRYGNTFCLQEVGKPNCISWSR